MKNVKGKMELIGNKSQGVRFAGFLVEPRCINSINTGNKHKLGGVNELWLSGSATCVLKICKPATMLNRTLCCGRHCCLLHQLFVDEVEVDRGYIIGDWAALLRTVFILLEQQSDSVCSKSITAVQVANEVPHLRFKSWMETFPPCREVCLNVDVKVSKVEVLREQSPNRSNYFS